MRGERGAPFCFPLPPSLPHHSNAHDAGAFLPRRYDGIERAPGSEGGIARKFLTQPAEHLLFSGRGGPSRELFLPGEIDEPGLEDHLRDLLRGLVEEPENLGGAQVVFGPAFAEQPFHESLLADRQQAKGKAGLDFWASGDRTRGRACPDRSGTPWKCFRRRDARGRASWPRWCRAIRSRGRLRLRKWRWENGGAAGAVAQHARG